MEAAREFSDMGSFFVRLGGAVALWVALYFGLGVAYSVVDYFLPALDFGWHTLYYEILAELPLDVAGFVVALIALFVVRCFVQGLPPGEEENIWRTLSRVVVVVIVLVSVVMIAIAGMFLFADILNGEFSVNRFVELLLTVAAGGGVLYYYLQLHRIAWVGKGHLNTMFISIATVISVIFIVMGIFILNPIHRSDFEDTLFNLSEVQRTDEMVQRFHATLGALPSSLDAIADLETHPPGTFGGPVPFGGKPPVAFGGLPSLDGPLGIAAQVGAIGTPLVLETLGGAYTPSVGTSRPLHERMVAGRRFTDVVTYEQVDALNYRLCIEIYTLPWGADLPGYPYKALPVHAEGRQCFAFTVPEVGNESAFVGRRQSL